MRGPFHQFCSGDTIEWFERHGVELKIEEDGRMFPVSNSSQTIIDCFVKATQKLGIAVLTGQSVQSIFKKDNLWKVETQHENYISEKKWKNDYFLVSSFDWNALQQVRFLNENIRIGVLTETDLDLAISFARFMKAEALHPDFQLLTYEYTAKIQEKDIKVFPWTVNEIDAVERMKSFKVDGIITDFLDRVY